MSFKQEEDPLSLTESQEMKIETEECDPPMACNKDAKHEIMSQVEDKVREYKPNIKTELEDVKREIKSEDCQTAAHVNTPILDLVPSIKTISELEDEMFLDKLLQFYGSKTQDEDTKYSNTRAHENSGGDLKEEINECFEPIENTNSVCRQSVEMSFQVDVSNKPSPMIPTIQRVQDHTNDCIVSNSGSNTNSVSQKSQSFNKTANNNSEKSFVEKTNFIKNTHIETNEKPFKCDKCSKSFSHKSSIITHTCTLGCEKALKCDHCVKSFSRKTDLIRHTRIHSNEKPFKCSYCVKSFSRRYHLIGHTRIHTHEKPFQCDFCSKSFSHQSNLIEHTRTHTNEKPFKCDYCEKAFCRKSDLNRHVRIHINEKPFECEFCGKSFSHVSDLNKHKRTHTKIFLSKKQSH